MQILLVRIVKNLYFWSATLCLLSAGLFIFSKHRFQQKQICELSSLKEKERLLLQKIFDKESQDVFLWNFFLEKEAKLFSHQIANTINFGITGEFQTDPVGCEPLFSEELSGYLNFLFSEQRELVIGFNLKIEKIRKAAKARIQELSREKKNILTKIQLDLEKYSFHVRQSQLALKPKQILLQHCQLRIVKLNVKKTKTCQSAIELVKMSEARDAENLNSNRNILMQKWSSYKSWIESEIKKIEMREAGPV